MRRLVLLNACIVRACLRRADSVPLHMAGCAAPVWRSLVATLARDHCVYAVDTIGDAGKSADMTRARASSDG